MSLWVGISSLVGADSLEGFAAGVTVSGALFLAITAPRRVRRRQAAVAATRGAPASASSAETGSAETGAFVVGLCGVGAFGAEAERIWPFGAEAGRVVQPRPGARDEAGRVVQPRPGARDGVGATSPTGRDGRPATYRSRHRLGDPIPDRAARRGALVGRTRRSVALPRSAFPGCAAWDDAQPGTPFPHVASCDVVFPDGAFRSSTRPAVRRLPRHAAPTVGFGTKVSGRVAGLLAARPLAGGAPS
jgi:hypothetical protein